VHPRIPRLTLANPERETNSPADEKPIRSGSNIVSRLPSALAAVLGLLYGGFNYNYDSNMQPLAMDRLEQRTQVTVVRHGYYI
jgi:hypothetical protein